MAEEIKATGKGFLTSAGQLKDRQTLAAEEKAGTKKVPQKNEDASSNEINEKSVSSALKSVRTRFSDKTNSVLNVVNTNDDNLKKAGDNVKEQIKVAKELKAAIKDDNDEVAAKKRAELADLQKKRDQIAEKIERDNQQQLTERVKSISFGNKPQKTVEVKAVEFDKSDSDTKLEKVKDVDKLIADLKQDRNSIKEQRQELRATRQEIKEVVKNVREQITNIEDKSINSAAEASKLADKIASAVVRAGAQDAVVSNVDESIVKALVAA